MWIVQVSPTIHSGHSYLEWSPQDRFWARVKKDAMNNKNEKTQLYQVRLGFFPSQKLVILI